MKKISNVLKAVFVSPFVRLAKKVARFFKAIWLSIKALFSLSKLVSQVHELSQKLKKLSDDQKIQDAVLKIMDNQLAKIIEKDIKEKLRKESASENDGATTPGGSEKTGNGVQNINFTKLMSAEGKKGLLDSVPFEIIVECFYQGSEKGSLDSASLAGYMVNHPGASIKVLAEIYNSDTIGYTKNEMERQGFGKMLDGMNKDELRIVLGLPVIN